MTTTARKVFSFATMMVLAQRRHEARMAGHSRQPEAATPRQGDHRESAMRRTLQKMNGTKRLLVVMYPA